MTGNLRIQMHYKTHPYPDYPASTHEAWGRLMLIIETESHSETLLEFDWTLNSFIEWFTNNIERIRHEFLPEIIPGESLAQALHRLKNRDFTDEDAELKWYKKLYDFRKSHSFRWAFPGTVMPDIIIGHNNNKGEISLDVLNDLEIEQEHPQKAFPPPDFLKQESWAYQFGMDNFCTDLKAEFKRFLDDWHQSTTKPAGKKRSKELLTLIEATSFSEF
jgi:hypothetical protein